MQTVRALVAPLEQEQGFRVHLPEEVKDFTELEPAVQHAREEASRIAEALALRAGAASVQVTVARRDHTVEASGDVIFLASEVSATATGRPRLAHESAD